MCFLTGLFFITIAAIFVLWILLSLLFRRVVDTNQVHIVRYSKKTIEYGKGHYSGNVYYAWPSWVPGVGVKVLT